MANVYFDSNNTAVGDGSIGNPYKALASYTAVSGDVLILASGATFFEGFTDTQLSADNMKITTSGTGQAFLDGSTQITAWTQSSSPGVWQASLGSNIGGNITENGSPMQSVIWTTDIATTGPTIPVGGFANDYNTGILYIRPSLGDPTRMVYRASTILHGYQSTVSRTGLTINNISFRQFSRHGLQLLNKTNVNVTNCSFDTIGGNASAGTYVGNGIEYGPGCSTGIIKFNYFVNIWDSPITTQLYANSTTTKNIEVAYNNINKFGLYGVEVSIVGSVTNCTLSNIDVHHNHITEAGYNWRPTNVVGRFIHVGGTQATSTFNNITIRENVGENNRWGISNNTGGAVINNVLFYRNIVTTEKSPSNGRGIYSNSSAVFRANICSGYFYGIVLYGTAVINYFVYNNTFYNCTEAIAWDGTNAPTLVIRNNIFWTNGGRFYRVLTSNTMLFDTNYNVIRSGITIGGPTLGGNDIRPTTLVMNPNFYFDNPVNQLIGAGTSVGTFKDLNGKFFKSPPSIGPYEYYS